MVCCSMSGLSHAAAVVGGLLLLGILNCSAGGPLPGDAPGWAVALAGRVSLLPVFRLYAKDFENGTFRITAPGKYVVMENVDFHPNPQNDFWPPFGSTKYPMGNFFLGFFAVFTVETKDVWIDLNGKVLQQSSEHYLKQRFFNVIELADRVFEVNEGVNSINFQASDPIQFAPGTVGLRTSADGVIISNGVLGRSSHNGIHGNGASKVYLYNLVVRGFEIAGIQLNAVHNAVIKNCVVGPSSTEVPVTAAFSSLRFLDFYANRIIPAGFAAEGFDGLLNDTVISFADRPGQQFTVSQVFANIHRAVTLYVNSKLGRPQGILTAADQDLLKSSKRLFDNEFGLPDGGAMYGIVLHRLGAATQQLGLQRENFENNDGTNFTTISNVTIQKLKNRPVVVLTLAVSDGTILQGTVRDSIRIENICGGDLFTPNLCTYRGDPLNDGYLAMWKLSNVWYTDRVWESDCGNFGSNVTAKWAPCTPLNRRNTSLTGRASSMLQKKYFGGLQLSQGLYNWATTPGKTLFELLETPQDILNVRRNQHHILCRGDTMHHVPKGIIGMRVDFATDVTVDNVNIIKLENLADVNPFVCTESWRSDTTGELVKPKNLVTGRDMAGDVRGIASFNSDDLLFNKLNISDLNTDEGWTFGIEIRKDDNDLTSYLLPVRGVSYSGVRIEKLQAGMGGQAIAHASDYLLDAASAGISVDSETPLQNNFKPFKRTFSLTVINKVLPPNSDPVQAWTSRNFVGFLGARYPGFDAVADRTRCLKFFELHYGFVIDARGSPVDTVLPVGTNSKLVPVATLVEENRAPVFCEGRRCAPTRTIVRVSEIAFYITAGPAGEVAHGVWGGVQGSRIYPGHTAACGMYGIDNSGLLPGNEQLRIKYYGVFPFDLEPLLTNFNGSGATLNFVVENEHLGYGSAVGEVTLTPVNPSDPTSGSYYLATNSLTFDDSVTTGAVTLDRAAPPALVPGIMPVTGVYPTQIRMQMDGVVALPKPVAGFDAFPATGAFHFVNEGGTKYLKRWTSYNTDSKILELRRKFLTTLRDRFGVREVGPNVSVFDNVPLDGIVDLGKGIRVHAYTLNEAMNFRTIYNTTFNTTTYSPLPSRIREGGFSLDVGRAGIISNTTQGGFIPPRSFIVMGEYAIQSAGAGGKSLQVYFESVAAVYPTVDSMMQDVRNVEEPSLGKGKSSFAIITKYDEVAEKYTFNSAGTMVWDTPGKSLWL